MGAVNGKRQEIAPENLSYCQNNNNNNKNVLLKFNKKIYCFNRYNIEIIAILITLIELCFILYQVTNFFNYFFLIILN